MIFFMTRSSRSTASSAWASWANVVRSTFPPTFFFQNIKIIGRPSGSGGGGAARDACPSQYNFFYFQAVSGGKLPNNSFSCVPLELAPRWGILDLQLKILGRTLEGFRSINNYRAKYNFRVICSALSDHHHFMRLWHYLHHFSLL